MIIRSILSLLLAFILFSISCQNPLDPRLETMQSQQAIWKSKNISDYDYCLYIGCSMCSPGGDFILHVKADTLFYAEYDTSSVFYDSATMDSVPKWMYSFLPTIEGLFQKVEIAIDRKAYTVDVSYDSIVGYPNDIYIDLQKQVIDDETHYFVSCFSGN
jgi:hypothetical protein